jgi:hypothetical protein
VFSNRPIIALTLVLSLITSDLVTFWHLGSCGSACCSTQKHCDSNASGCRHSENPFASRHGIHGDGIGVKKPIKNSRPAPTDELPGESDHSDACSLCRWLVTARNSANWTAKTASIDLVPFPFDAASEWMEPSSKPRHCSVSRRGPPVFDFTA